MVSSSSGSGADRPGPELSQAPDTTADAACGAQACEDSQGPLQYPENSRWEKASNGRESGLVVRLFPNPPQIFGASQAQQQHQPGRDHDRYRDSAETLSQSELRPLEAEALSLSRMLKSLQPPPQEEFSFPTSGLSTEPESPPATPAAYTKRTVVAPADSTVAGAGAGAGGEAYAGTDDSVLPRSPRGLRLQARDKNDAMPAFSPSSYGNSALSPTKSPKSRRRTPGGFAFSSSRGSTPSSSVGSASELQFPVVLQSPSSPEPLRPGSPLKWSSRISPVEDTPVIENGIRETPVQGLVQRNPSFAMYIPHNVSSKLSFEDVSRNSALSSSEITGSDSSRDLSAVVQKLKQQQQQYPKYISLGEFELNGVPLGLADLDSTELDISFALEYRGPPINHVVPKVDPLDLTAVRSPSPDEAFSPSISVAPPSPARSRRSIPGLTVPSPDSGATGSFFTPINISAETGAESPRLKRPPRNRPSDRQTNSEVPQIAADQGYGDIRHTGNSSPEAGPTVARNRRNSMGDDFSSKGYSFSSHSFRGAVAESTLTPSKSEPFLFKRPSKGYKDDDSIRDVTHKLGSASMSGIDHMNCAGYQGGNFNYGETDVIPQQRRKGECWVCGKGHWLYAERESCLVCNAKYCYNCILTAMESMPEGRKCKDCIGKPVDDTRRASIGKPSKLLNRLLSPQEVQQIMKAEKECAANQLKPDQLWVNGRQLSAEELSVLLGCPNPPQKLKPGKYWYDKQSGLWGKRFATRAGSSTCDGYYGDVRFWDRKCHVHHLKDHDMCCYHQEGERPDKLITHDLKVGGILKENASKGTTQVFMNNRELGKLELRMLKTSIRLLYPFFSLPTPGPNNRFSREDQRDSPDVYVPDYLTQNKLHKLLLLGHEGSGRSTIFKQTKFLFKDGFDEEERQKMKAMIQCNIYRYAIILLEGRERFEEEDEDLAEIASYSPGKNTDGRRSIYALDEKLKTKADWFLDVMAEGDLETVCSASNHEYASLVVDLWKDPAIKATYKRKDELSALPHYADYFLDKVTEFSSNEYVPSPLDIIRAEGLAQGSGLAEVEFSLDDKISSYQDVEGSSPERYQLIKVGGKGMAEGCKWLDMFEDVHAVIFCVAISDYDQVCPDFDGVLRSKLRQTELFESVLKHPVLREKPFVLLLNKYDLFEDKFCKDVPLTTCEWFTDFKPVGASQMTPQWQAQQAYTYVVHKYKELFANGGYKVFTFKLMATEQEKVLEAFQYVREILKWKDNNGYEFVEESSYSTDMSSYSQHTMHAGRDVYHAER
ncbi:hypothetical protein AXG93_3384s1030 [Marchantia polymorpha subsp. ruderalis]|uniref:Uncharacterized protein n=1 Tax=Marchantia polymorpha subsp. ruderalis TaxID=1480154 RepID=A0A176WEW8_MARPO|nr:hypothetical protein AXG93_3384s1030 [Marchantia polymorpha subsp. ruderalis]